MIIQNIDDNDLAKIEELISKERLERFKQTLEMRTRRLVLCLEDIFHPHNASATIRTAEAFGLQEINVIENTCRFSPSVDIVRGTDKWIDINHWKSPHMLIDSLHERGYRIIATSPRPGSSTIDEFSVNGKPIALFMGTEKTGISHEVELNADGMLYIPMFGLAESLNISVSAAIIIQRIIENIHKLPKSEWELSSDEKKKLLIKWIASSVRGGEHVIKTMLNLNE